MNEEWKDVPGYEGLYKVSDKGRIWSDISQRYIKLQHDKKGYLIYAFTDKYGRRKTEKIHRLVALAFLGEPPSDKTCVNHKNEIKDDNRVDNLMWCSVKENNCWGTRLNRAANALSKQVLCIETGIIYLSAADAHRQTGISRGHICDVCRGERNTAGGYSWKYV